MKTAKFKVGEYVTLTQKYLDNQEYTNPMDCMIVAGTEHKYLVVNHCSYNGLDMQPTIKIYIDGTSHGTWMINDHYANHAFRKPTIIIRR